VPVKFSKAALASAGLSALFLGVYGGCNWFTSLRSDVGTLYFSWERYIPFVPMMVIPYMSIDLFFVGAPFICRSNQELATFARRVTAAILIAGVCFLLFPLRFAFARPHTGGWIGALFDWFRGMDMPYNMLPSLHIALRTFLGDTYSRHTSGVVRVASNTWFSLIAISTLLTYQHHVMDVVGGFALAGYCFYCLQEFPVRLPVTENRRVGSYYLAGALLMAVIILLFRRWSFLLFWPGSPSASWPALTSESAPAFTERPTADCPGAPYGHSAPACWASICPCSTIAFSAVRGMKSRQESGLDER